MNPIRAFPINQQQHEQNQQPRSQIITLSPQLKRRLIPTTEINIKSMSESPLKARIPTQKNEKLSSKVETRSPLKEQPKIYLKPAFNGNSEELRLPSLSKSNSNGTVRKAKRSETQIEDMTKSSLLKVYQEKEATSPLKLRRRLPTREGLAHIRSQSNPSLIISEDGPKDIIKLFTARSQAGKNPNRQTKTNQDSVFMVPNFGGVKNRSYYGVCDGHGVYGHYVSQIVKKILPQHLDSAIKQNKSTTEELSHQQMTAYFQNSNCGVDISFSGTTCVTVLVNGMNVFCANIGDSRANNNDWQIKLLSNDHKPELPAERKRIIQSKGRVQPYIGPDGLAIGPHRVWLANDQVPGLAMSRSFGDYVASTVGVISDPEIGIAKLEGQCGFIAIASDGVWEFLTNENVCAMIQSQWCENMTQSKMDQLVDSIIKESTLKWEEEDEVIDDISLVLIYFDQK